MLDTGARAAARAGPGLLCAAETYYLGPGEDHRLLQVLQHEGQHRGGKGHGVRAVDDHKALVLCVVSLLEGKISERTRAFDHRPSPGNMVAGSYPLTGHEKEERPECWQRAWCGITSSPPAGSVWKASLCLESL